MIHLVLEHPGEQAPRFYLRGLAIFILARNRDLARTFDVAPRTGNAQAAFFEDDHFLTEFFNFRIENCIKFYSTLTIRNFCDKHTQVEADLVC